MSLLTILIALIVIGLLLWVINTYIPMDSKIKNIINILVVIVVIVWLLKASGVWASLAGVTV
jgi:hypothetical protein